MNSVQTPELATEEILAPDAPKHTGLAIALVLLQDRMRIVVITLVAMALGAGISLLMKNTFLAKATILPPQSAQSSTSALLGQLGSLAGLMGGGSLLKNPADTYVGVLEGSTVSDKIIAQFHLQELWHQKTLEGARRVLKGHAEFEAAKDGLIVITVKDHDPKLASDMANAFINQLYASNADLAITEAAQRRQFFDKELQEEKQALATAEDDLKATQEKTGLIELAGQSELAIRSIAQVQAEIKSREVELEALRTYETNQNPEVVRLESEISTMRDQLNALQNDQKNMPTGDTAVPAGRVPAEGLEYVRKYREVKYHETLFELLARQYEAARIDEAKSAPTIQVVDRAVPPDLKSGPPRTLITLGFGVFGFCLACFLAFLRHSLARMRKDPESAAQLNQLSTILHFRL